VIDGEAVARDENGVAVFDRLREKRISQPCIDERPKPLACFSVAAILFITGCSPEGRPRQPRARSPASLRQASQTFFQQIYAFTGRACCGLVEICGSLKLQSLEGASNWV
jgi:hypothetical protein